KFVKSGERCSSMPLDILTSPGSIRVVNTTTELRIAIRDDGRGISPELLRSGRAHRGLTWMQQLAHRIGGRLRLFSRPTGTEMELLMPGHIAFASHRSVRPSGVVDPCASCLIGAV